MVGQSVSRTTTSSSSNESALQAVLASLDIQVEEELARYRRHRLVQRRLHPGRRSPTCSPANESPTLQSADPKALLPTASLAPTSSSDPIPSPWDEADTVAIAPGLQSPSFAPEVTSSLPEDYLESSEHLLRSLADESVESDYEESGDRLIDGLLTPLGVGLLLLFLVASAMLGFLIVNPSMLGFETWGQLFQRRSDDASSSTVQPTDPSEQSNLHPYPDLSADEFVNLNLETLSTIRGRSSLIPPMASNPSPKPSASPSSAEEQAGVNSLSVTPIGAIASAPSIISTTELPGNSWSADPAPAVAPPAVEASVPDVAPAVEPEPVAAAPAYVEPAPSSSAPVANSDASGEYFYVVTDYSGDRSLEDAQAVVGDAYVRNFDSGAQVQLGAFSSADRAQELINELQQQGISAQMYQP
ncbi:MAG: SPOR domain-containing protein [Synechococcales cyanobacterium T60_A2020_003]|nr:SPOR domain-containing protein [Synechococcales cyanobacterium T60_A2020_003]